MVVQVKMRRLGYWSRQRDGVLEKPSNPLHYCSATLLLCLRHPDGNRNADAKTRPTV